MYVPLITPLLNRNPKTLERRKGGGGGARGGSAGGGAKGGGASSSGGGAKSSGSKSSGPGSSSGSGSRSSSGQGGSAITAKTATGSTGTLRPGGPGSTVITTIPGGQPFAGRSAGGGTRSGIYGTSSYGSGYPGISSSSVLGRGFPYYFWPLTFGGVVGLSGIHYAHNIQDNEYGKPDNATRPGGPQFEASILSSNTTYRLMADNATIQALLPVINASCSPTNGATLTASPYNDSSPFPKPEQAIQYYRASSIVLTLDGYNNTADFANDTGEGAPLVKDTPLPSDLNQTFLNCLNNTIGNQAVLFENAALNIRVSGWLALILVGIHLLNA